MGGLPPCLSPTVTIRANLALSRHWSYPFIDEIILDMDSENDKARRLEVGSAEKSRKVSAPQIRAFGYLVAHACFDCRKSFKLPTDPTKPIPPRWCPSCGGELRWMGRSFAAPKRTDIEQWKKVEALWIAGFRFHSYRSHPDAERLPDKLKDVADFVRRNPRHPFRMADRRRE